VLFARSVPRGWDPHLPPDARHSRGSSSRHGEGIGRHDEGIGLDGLGLDCRSRHDEGIGLDGLGLGLDCMPTTVPTRHREAIPIYIIYIGLHLTLVLNQVKPVPKWLRNVVNLII